MAENHYDLPTLVWLCHDPVAGSGPARIQRYIEQFGAEFAFILYEWYIQEGASHSFIVSGAETFSGRLHALQSQDEVYGGLVTRFFETYGYPELAWMHQIACKRYADAGLALLAVDAQTEELSQRHVRILPKIGCLAHAVQLVSSIGKLAAVAAIKSNGNSKDRIGLLSGEFPFYALDCMLIPQDLDDELELVNLQNILRESLLSSPIKGQATLLDGRPVFKDLFVDLAQQLANGTALDVESLVDVLTLKDNVGISSRDAATALDRLMKDQVRVLWPMLGEEHHS